MVFQVVFENSNATHDVAVLVIRVDVESQFFVKKLRGFGHDLHNATRPSGGGKDFVSSILRESPPRLRMGNSNS